MSAAQPYVPGIGETGQAVQPFRKAKLTELRIWWREIDHVLLVLVLALMAIGTAAVATASVASADQLSNTEKTLPDFYFFWPHLRWQAMGIVTMILAAMLSKENARRLGIVLAIGMIGALMLVPIPGIGHTVNGAQRWLDLGFRFQPSEFLKPGFAILLAWILSWRLRDPNLPVLRAALGVIVLVGGLLMLQPNLGAAILFSGVWFAMMLLAGVPLQRLVLVIGLALTALIVVYLGYENGRNRIDAFLGGGVAFDQVDLARRTLLAGGWTGSGLWLGIRKMSLPEAHTDYIFSVIGEEFGLIACGVIVLLYLAILVRVLSRLVDEENLFTLLAGAGLVTQICGQAFINILVNLQLAPSKGMTLPLVSYGGSSTIAVCLTVGLLLATTRRNPFLHRETTSLRAMHSAKESQQ